MPTRTAAKRTTARKTRTTRTASTAISSDGSDAKTTQQWVYLFSQGNADMKHLLGGKGAGIAEMMRIGLPVPPGFTITTEACNEYFARGQKFPPGLWTQVLSALQTVEKQSGRRFGSANHPLLVSVRSGAKFSMPGMMDTVLNLGLNDVTATALARLTGDERFALDAFRRFIQLYSKVVLRLESGAFEEILDATKQDAGVTSDSQIPPAQLRKLIVEYRALVLRETGKPFPADPGQQVQAAIAAAGYEVCSHGWPWIGFPNMPEDEERVPMRRAVPSFCRLRTKCAGACSMPAGSAASSALSTATPTTKSR